jgi:hypothetical protein
MDACGTLSLNVIFVSGTLTPPPPTEPAEDFVAEALVTSTGPPLLLGCANWRQAEKDFLRPQSE